MTVVNWEKGATQPAVRCLPRIFDFLGYAPESQTSCSLGEELIQYRRLKGMSQKKMASILQVDPSTLARWERGQGKPSEATLKKLDMIFQRNPSIFP